jgi:hypothetical protein
LKVHTVSLRRYVSRFQIYYHHGADETLVDESDDEVGHEYETWLQAAAQHARDNNALFLDKT